MTACQGAPSGRPSGSGPGSPTRGSRNGRFRWTGPGQASGVGDGARPIERHASRMASSGAPGSRYQRTATPYRRVWSIVCGAATPCSSPGRSAVHTTSGTSAWLASTTAPWKCVAAVPLVHKSTAGRPVARPRPRAKKRGGTLVVVYVQPELGSGRQRKSKRRRAGTGCEDGVGDAGAHPLVHQCGAERRCGCHRHPRILAPWAWPSSIWGGGSRRSC